MNENVPQPQPAYPPPPQYVYVQAPAAPPRPRTSGLAVTALVTGIVGLVFSWVPILDLVLAVIAIVFGSLGWHYASSRNLAGKGMGIAGLTMGIITMAIFVILLIAL
jgi:hypothetical protein